jgi:uncharacterized membrane protein YcaP (DUF421 family)
VVLVENGKILHDNLTRTQFNVDDLRQEIHKQGLDFTDLSDIKLARLESSGDFSIIKSPDIEPVTKRDLENQLKSIYDNPLSPAGVEMAKLEQFMADVRVLAEQVRQQQDSAREQGVSQAPPVH